MHLQVVLAFALLLWWPEGDPAAALITDPAMVALFVWGKLPFFGAIALSICQVTRHRLSGNATSTQRVLSRYHRASFVLRLMALGGIAADLFLTSWPAMLNRQTWLSYLPGLAQFIALAPYLLALVLTWWLLYPAEHATRDSISQPSRQARWRYIIFNIRHQVLIVALPLGIILVAYEATRLHRNWFVRVIGSPWAPEAVLVLVAIVLFILSPVMLRRVWATSPLPDGPLRRKLLQLCDRIGLRVREILIWHSDGLMVNAAVMGLFPRVRYILLSDSLLDSMTDEEIEAVFGHEAGHVRHHHIQYFLLFAIASMLICSGVMECLTRLAQTGQPRWQFGPETIQAIGLASVIPVWGIAFGWISRRFERQADIFGAACAAPPHSGDNCRLPCVIHDPSARPGNDAICATGARTFVQALRKVSLLNGIPPTERSWRHSSIASRIRFLTALSADPIMTRGFTRCVRRTKVVLVLACVVGLGFGAVYTWRHPGYRRAIEKSIIEPVRAWAM
jgi:STE24 endopeptidase